MAVPFYLIQWQKKGDTTNLSTITDYLNVSVDYGIEVKSNKFNLPLKNSLMSNVSLVGDHPYQIDIQEEDKIYIYADWDNITKTDTQLLISGTVEKYGGKYTSKKNPITISGSDRSILLLKQSIGQVFKDITVPNMIKKLASLVSNDTITTTGVATTKSDGSAFEAKDLGFDLKPLYEWFSLISTPEYTNDSADIAAKTLTEQRNYVFYIDQNNDLKWFYPEDATRSQLNTAITSSSTSIILDDASDFTSSGVISIDNEQIYYTGVSVNTLTGLTRGYNNTIANSHDSLARVTQNMVLVEGSADIYNADIRKDAYDVVNMIIFRAGPDLNGNPILSYAYNRNSSSSELKIKVMSWTDLSENQILHKSDSSGYLLVSARSVLNGSISSTDTTLTLDSATDFSSSGVIRITSADGFEYVSYTGVSGSDLTGLTRGLYGTSARSHNSTEVVLEVTNLSSMSNSDFKELIIEEGRKRAETYFKSTGFLKFEGNVEVRGGHYRPGDLISIYIPSIGATNGYNDPIEMRIQDVTHNLTNKSWFTTLKVSEDEPKRL